MGRGCHGCALYQVAIGLQEASEQLELGVSPKVPIILKYAQAVQSAARVNWIPSVSLLVSLKPSHT